MAGLINSFFNSSGNVAFYAPDALRKIGAINMAELTEQANSIFGVSGPELDWSARQEILLSFDDKYEAFLSDLDARFYKYPDNLDELLRAYVSKHY